MTTGTAWVRGYRRPLVTLQVDSQLISRTANSPWTESFSYLVTWNIARLAMATDWSEKLG